MSVNKYLPHVFVLPEDDANSDITTGFSLDVPTRQFQVLPVVGGWTHVLECFLADHIIEMDRRHGRFMILLIDFDGEVERPQQVKARIPGHLNDRVFILGALNEPEDLKADLGPYETIGLALARDCRDETYTTWGHALLRHNASELERLREHVRPLLFPTN